jgi:type VI secretion system protein ImpM
VTGFFGKVPAHGDFITRDLPRGFLDVWDAWLQTSIAESRAQLGDRWLDVYLTCPIWRFGLVPGLCGAEAWAGIVMASVDRVGRYFPLTIATPLPPAVNPLQLPGFTDSWFDTVESLALRTLDDDRFDANALHEALAAMPPIPIERAEAEVSSAAGSAWSVVVLGPPGAKLPLALAHTLISRESPRYSLWWTPGSDAAAPAGLVVAGLPEPPCFVDLLHGTWSEAALAVEPTSSEPADPRGAAYR